MNKKISLFLIGIWVLSGLFIDANTVLANNNGSGFFNVPNLCANQTIIYAQDIEGVTPGPDNDSAIINNRNGSRILTESQGSDDDYVFWSQNIEVEIKANDTLYYT